MELPKRAVIAGNPVFSVYQTDIVIYGRDLHRYLEHEFWRKRTSTYDFPNDPLLERHRELQQQPAVPHGLKHRLAGSSPAISR